MQKLMAAAGVASRRHAEELIKAGRVTVDGVTATLGMSALATAQIRVDGKLVSAERLVYLLLNKPAGVVSTVKDAAGRKTVRELVDLPLRIYPVGRLDYNTSGTLLLTNDGALTHKLLHPSFAIKKVYRARLDRALTAEELAYLNGPVLIDGARSIQQVIADGPRSYVVTLTAGLNHHVKRLFMLVGCTVLTLSRIEFAGISHVNDLPSGAWRYLKPFEIKKLFALVKQIKAA